MREFLVSAADHRWNDAIRDVAHDVYHFPQYAQLCARTEGGDARAFVATDGGCTFFVPIIVRDVPGGICMGERILDATVPYGYPGPLVACGGNESAADRDSFLRRALTAFMARLRDEGIVSAFFRLHPLLPIDCETLSQFGSLVPNGETVAIDLSLSQEARWRQLRSNHRRDISKAEAAGQIAEVDHEWSGLVAFVQAYRETMRRVGANPYYLFDDEYYWGLREALGEHLHLWSVRSGSEVIAGALFTECRGIVQYHLGGTLDEHRQGYAMKLLFHRASEWFKARNNRWLHLGGGVGGRQDSLMHFKIGFSPLTFRFYTWRLILDPRTYEDLVARTGRSGDPGASSFFPPYRQLSRSQVLTEQPATSSHPGV